jgi:trans-aconitate methyltransferase
MPPKQHPRKPRGTDARQLIAALRKAGVSSQDIVLTSTGHLQVTCPGGVVTLPSELSQARTYANSRKTLADHGVHIPARGGSARRGTVRQKHYQQARQAGMITRCKDHELYALVTTQDGVTWFISKSHLRPDVAQELAERRFVTFTGNPVPELHKRYPQAADVRLAAPFPAGSRPA